MTALRAPQPNSPQRRSINALLKQAGRLPSYVMSNNQFNAVVSSVRKMKFAAVKAFLAAVLLWQPSTEYQLPTTSRDRPAAQNPSEMLRTVRLVISPSCAESTMRLRQINSLAEKLALHFG
jgi:hypothetical protein